MALKVAEVYVEIFPKINSAARKAAVASIAQDFDKAFGDAFDRSDRENAASTQRQVNTRRRGNADMRRDLDNTGNAFSRFFRNNDNFAKKNEGSFHKMATQLRTIGTVIRGIAIPLALVGALNGVGLAIEGITAAAPIAAAAVLAIPAAIAGMAVEAIVLKAAFKGVGKTIGEAFDPKKAKQFQEDLKNLAPAAQKFVLQIARIKGVLPNIQQTFFSQKSLQDAAARVRDFASGISRALKQLVAANGNLFGRILGTVTGNRGTKEISSFLSSMASLLRQITPGLTAVSAGFLRLISVVGGQGAAHGGGINGALLKFAKFLQTVDVKKVFDLAIAAAKGFGQILGNLGGIIGGIGRALGGQQALGAAFFKNIIGITKTIKDFVNSQAGQTFIKQLVQVLGALSHIANVVIANALKLIANIFVGLAPVLLGLEPSIIGIVNAIGRMGPAITAVALPALQTLAAAFNIIAPILTSILNDFAAHPQAFAIMAGGLAAIAGSLFLINDAMSKKSGILLLVTAAVILLPKLAAMGGAFKVLAIALGVAAAAWVAYTLAQSASGIGLILTAVGLLSVAIFELATHWHAVWKAVTGFLHSSVGQIVLLIFGIIDPIFSIIAVTNILFQHWKSIWHAILVTTNVVVHGILIAVNDISHWFTVSLPHAAAVLWANMVRYWNATLGIIVIVRNGILNVVNAISHWFTVSVPHAASVLWQRIFAFWNLIRGYTNNLRGWIVGAFNAVLRFFSTTVYNGLKRLATFALGVWKGMVSSLNRYFIAPVKGAFNAVVEAIRTTWAKIQNYIFKPIEWVVVHVYNKGIAPLWNAVSNVVGKVLGHLNPIKLSGGGSTGAAPTRNAGGGSRAALADGGLLGNNGMGRRILGRVRGPGGPREDLIPALLSNGEFVIKEQTVRALGTSFFENINKYGSNRVFVGGDPSAALVTTHNFAAGGQAKFAGNIGNWVSGAAPVGGEVKKNNSITATLAWLASIKNRIPYVLGSNGPNAFDCSSLVGEVWARLTRHPTNRRYMVTGTEGAWARKNHFKPGTHLVDSLQIGWNGEHTTGALAGHPFEAAHTGTKMRFGPGATSPLSFPNKMYLPVGKGGSLLSGVLGFIENLAGKGLQYLSKPLLWLLDRIPGLKNFRTGMLGRYVSGKDKKSMVPIMIGKMAAAINSQADKKEAEAEARLAAESASSLGNPSNLRLGHGQFNAWVMAASKFVNIPKNWLPWLLKIMKAESGGNPNAINRSDSNAAAGHPSQGLMQLIPSTFNANHAAGTSQRITNPVANIAAAINYIHRRYGTIFNTPWAKGTGTFYGQGGLVKPPQLFDQGGIWKSGQVGVNMSGHDEAVFSSPSQLAKAGGPSKIEVHAYFGTEKLDKIMDSRIANYEDDVQRWIVTR